MKESLNDKAKGSATKAKSNSSEKKTDKLETKKVDSSKKSIKNTGKNTSGKKSGLLTKLKAIGVAVLVLGGIVGGYFILQNSTHYTVTLASVPGINYTYNSLSVKNGEDFIFDFELEETFVVYDDLFSVTVNGQKMEKTNDKYEIKNVNNDLKIFISGVGSSGLNISNKTLTGVSNVSENMYVPFGVETIEEYSVQGNTAVKHLVIPDSVKIIKNNAFYNCFNLETIELGKNVERMGQGAFSNTAWFSNKTFGMVYLGNWLYSFKGTSDSKHFVIKEGTVGIGQYAFINLSNMETIELPSTLKYIESNAFSCIKLKELNLPNGLKYIGRFTFVDTNITTLHIPASVEEIDEYAFIVNKSLKEVVIDSVSTFGTNTFSGCEVLETVLFTNGANNISAEMFADCKELKEIIINSSNVPTMQNINAFALIPNIKIYVPENDVVSYKTANGWSVFTDLIFAINTLSE